jgi:hypothetical protein
MPLANARECRLFFADDDIGLLNELARQREEARITRGLVAHVPVSGR